MKIVEHSEQPLSGVHKVRFGRFADRRGYFTETFRRSELAALGFLDGVEFSQCNESFSREGVVRGLHFQWNPRMGKLVRTIHGRMVDLILDVRLGSPSYGRAIAIDLPARPEDPESTWVWIPPGFAHGNFFTEPTTIEYFCSGEYSPACEAGISPFASDIDWSLCDAALKAELDGVAESSPLVSDRDRGGLTVEQWGRHERSSEFVMGQC